VVGRKENEKMNEWEVREMKMQEKKRLVVRMSEQELSEK